MRVLLSDYHFQADYLQAWARIVGAFQRLADACPTLRVSMEWKPTDASSRFSFVPSTAAALMLVQHVGRQNFGLTLDTGHLLMAGESAAHSIAMVGSAGKLFGMHLNDGHARLGAEDGLAFGSVHPVSSLEVVYWLRKVVCGLFLQQLDYNLARLRLKRACACWCTLHPVPLC